MVTISWDDKNDRRTSLERMAHAGDGTMQDTVDPRRKSAPLWERAVRRIIQLLDEQPLVLMVEWHELPDLGKGVAPLGALVSRSHAPRTYATYYVGRWKVRDVKLDWLDRCNAAILTVQYPNDGFIVHEGRVCRRRVVRKMESGQQIVLSVQRGEFMCTE